MTIKAVAQASASTHCLARTVTDAMRNAIATRDGYEVVDPSVLRDVARLNYPELALAVATHSGAVITGTIVG